MSTAVKITEKVVEKFKTKNADWLACQRETPAQILDLASADASLDPEIISDLQMYSNPELIDQQDHYARTVAREDLERTLYQSLAKSVLRLYHTGMIHPAIRCTNEADAEYQQLKIAAGLEQAPPPPPKPKSAAEQLDEQIRFDWVNLPADKIRLKQNDPKYKKRLNELLESDAIKSQATSKYDIGEVGG